MSSETLWIVTGGQTGVDRAALDVALEYRLPLRGWCPKGRLAEDGTIAAHYPLQETPSEKVEQRTEWNARDSDGTLLLSVGNPKDGTNLTAEMALKYRKPLFSRSLEQAADLKEFHSWLQENSIRILNIAGPRESHRPGYVYARSVELLREYLRDYSRGEE